MDFSVSVSSQNHVLFVTPVMPTLNGRGPGFRAYQWVQHLMKQFERISVLCTSVYGEYDPIPKEFTRNQQVVIYKSLEVTSYFRRFLNVVRLKPSTYNSANSEYETFIDSIDHHSPDLIIGFKITSLPVVNRLKNRFKNARTALDIDEVNSNRICDIVRLMKKNGQLWNAYKLFPEIVGYRILEKTALRNIDIVIVSTEKERDLFERVSAYRPCIVFENRFPIKEPCMSKNDSSFQFLFVGNSIHYPNKDAIETIVNKILPEIKHRSIKEFKITIIGGEPELAIRENLQRYNEIEYLRDTDDLDSIYKQTDVALIPLRSGGGSSLKVLEALANKKVVISTTIGVRGFTLKHGVNCLVTDDLDKFAEYCLNLMEDSVMRNRLAEKGHHWFLKNQSYKTFLTDSTEKS